MISLESEGFKKEISWTGKYFENFQKKKRNNKIMKTKLKKKN